jgi:SAM-dependent methyltransferase
MSIRTRLQALTDPSQFDLEPAGAGAVLDVGCGSKKYPGSVGVDISPNTDADIVHDLDTYPWPIDDSSFDQVLMQDVIEHIAEPYRLMSELHRICRPGARIRLRTPHYSSVLAYSDPTHRHYFSALGIRALAEPGFSHYSDSRFEVVSIDFDSWLPYRMLGVGAAANRWKAAYEQYFAFMFTSMNIRADFRVLK